MPPHQRFYKSTGFEIYENVDVVYMDAPVYSALYSTASSILNSVTFEDVAFSYSVENAVFEGRYYKNCSSEITPAICLVKLQIQKTLDECKCIPFSYLNLIHLDNSTMNSTYCTTKNYEKCHEKLQASYKANQAWCRDTCEYILYKWKPYIWTFSGTAKLVHRAYSIGEDNAPFTQFTLLVRDSPERFLSQVGGLINLYLGFSGLHLCAVAILCVELFKKWKKEKKTVVENDQQPVSTTPQLFQLTSNFGVGQQVQNQGIACSSMTTDQTEDLDQVRQKIRKIEQTLANVKLEVKRGLQDMKRILTEVQQERQILN